MPSPELRAIKREIRDSYEFLRGIEGITITEKSIIDENMDELKIDLDSVQSEGDITTMERDAAKADADEVKTSAAALPTFTKSPAIVTVSSQVINSFVNQLDWSCVRCNKKIIMIFNTGANNIDYKVLTRTKYTGVEWEEISSTELVTADKVRIELLRYHARVIVAVKSHTADEAISFEIDACGASKNK